MRPGMSSIRIALALSKKGNKNLVANDMNISTDHLNKEVRLFEKECGITLFEKVGGEVVTTSDGVRLFTIVGNLLSLLEQLTESRKKNCLRIAFSNRIPAYAFVAPIMDYCLRHSGSNPNISVCSYSDLEAKIKLGLTDIAVTSDNEMLMGDAIHIRGDYELNMLLLKDDPMYTSENFVTKSMAGLKPLITLEEHHNGIVRDWIGDYGKTLIAINDITFIRAFTEKGFGCGVIPYTPSGYDSNPLFRTMPFYPAIRPGFVISIGKSADSKMRAEPFIAMLKEKSDYYHISFK